MKKQDEKTREKMYNLAQWIHGSGRINFSIITNALYTQMLSTYPLQQVPNSRLVSQYVREVYKLSL